LASACKVRFYRLIVVGSLRGPERSPARAIGLAKAAWVDMALPRLPLTGKQQSAKVRSHRRRQPDRLEGAVTEQRVRSQTWALADFHCCGDQGIA
jgi:hypothetical protein